MGDVMKISGLQKSGFAFAAVIAAAVSTANVFGQTTIATPTPMFHDTTPSSDTATATVPSPATALTPAMTQVLQLSQAKISDGTIITYIQNSGTIYGLNASQIVYLKQQGVSEPVINAMLNQRTMAAASSATPPVPDYSAQAAATTATTVAQPTTPAPSSVYVVPDSQTYYYDNWAYPYTYPYYYPYYYGYGWPVGVYWGGWGWRGGWHGGYYGGWHGGFGGGGFHGGFNGGGFHGGFGGGFHGGGGGFHH